MNRPTLMSISLLAAAYAATPVSADNAFSNLQAELVSGDAAHKQAKAFFKAKQKDSGCASVASAMEHFKTVAWYADGMDNPGAPALVKKAKSGIKDVTKLQQKQKCSLSV